MKNVQIQKPYSPRIRCSSTRHSLPLGNWSVCRRTCVKPLLKPDRVGQNNEIDRAIHKELPLYRVILHSINNSEWQIAKYLNSMFNDGWQIPSSATQTTVLSLCCARTRPNTQSAFRRRQDSGGWLQCHQQTAAASLSLWFPTSRLRYLIRIPYVAIKSCVSSHVKMD